MDPQMLQQLMGMYSQMQTNPMTRNLPGDRFMGEGPMGLPGIPGADALGSMMQEGQNVPTDFAGTPPGLPNLPQDLQGFGFGQTAPEYMLNNSLRKRLISQLLSQLDQGSMGAPGMPIMGGM